MNLLWLIPLLPFAGAAILGGLRVFGRPPKSLVTLVGLGAPGLSLLLSLNCLWQFLGTAHAPVEKVLYAWTTGELKIDFAFLLDPLSAVMLFVVTFIGFLIHVYSVGYMGHEEGYRRYFAYLNLFMGSMLLLILGNNYLVMFMGWEGVGLCSYLLIGFYYDQEVPPAAGKKAFIVNRIGDFAFLVGMFALFAKFGSLRYLDLFPRIAADPSTALAQYHLGGMGMSLASFIALCFFVGAMGKSAQIPLYVWLPDAMAGPTPVSALIHAATMVTAGVYMVARTNVLYQLAPGVSGFVALIGAATALFAATIGLAQTDIKKVLAYSTVSQLGYMFLAAGLGAYSTSIFHVMTHAFFKALLFLGSGSVIHAMSGEQDMRKMGGLKAALPITYRTFLIGALAIAGIFPFAGFFSKDAILAAAAGGGHWGLYLVGLFTAGLTAFYMFRAVFLTFDGEFRGTEEQHHHLHESPASMTVPLILLAAGAIGAGWVGIPEALTGGKDWDLWDRFLSPTIYQIAGYPRAAHEMGAGTEILLSLVALAVAGLGIFLAYRTYGGKRGAEKGAAWEAGHAGLQRVLANKYWVDEIYDRLIVRPLAWTSRVILWKTVDNVVIDGAVKAGAFTVDVAGHAGRLTTTGNVRNYALYFFLGILLLFWWMTFS
jgi:NADH-quinone oxidoreductase subunit L